MAHGTLDRAGFDQWYGVMYAPHDWPAGSMVTLSWEHPWRKTKEGRPVWESAHVDASDPEGIFRAIEENGTDRKTLVGIAARSMEALEVSVAAKQQRARDNGWRPKSYAETLKYTRGGIRESVSLTGLWLELDFRTEGDTHKKEDVPPREYIEWLLDVFPLRPTLKVFTGGGYHAWFAFAELLDRDEEDRILALASAWVKARKAAGGWDLDDGVFNRDRCLRPGGSLIGKRGNLNPVEIVECNPQMRYTADDFDLLEQESADAAVTRIAAWLEGRPLSEDEKAVVGDTPRPTGARAYRELPSDVSNWKPGDRLSYKLPVSVLLEHVFGMRRMPGRRSGGDRWDVPRGDGTYSEGSAATSLGVTYTDENRRTVTKDDGIERVRVFGRTAAEVLGLEVKGTPATSYVLIAKNFCGTAGFRLARRIAIAFEEDPDALVELLAAGPSPDDLDAAATARRPERRRRTVARPKTLSEIRSAAVGAPLESPGSVSVLATIRAKASPPAPAPVGIRDQVQAVAEARQRRLALLRRPAA